MVLFNSATSAPKIAVAFMPFFCRNPELDAEEGSNQQDLRQKPSGMKMCTNRQGFFLRYK
jgi:hypothetical protein